MTYLGIDYGTKRVGLAKGNSQQRLAMPFGAIPNDKELRNILRNIIDTEGVSEIVIGVPISFDGQEHETARQARLFGESLKELGVPVHFVNEILTSKQSRDSGAKDVDASAAALILQSFLDSHTS